MPLSVNHILLNPGVQFCTYEILLDNEIFADKVICRNPPLPGELVHALPDLNHNQTNHNTKLMEHWCIATVA